MKELQKYNKAIWGFVVAFIGALVSQVQSGVEFSLKVALLALGTAVVTSGAVYQARNTK